MEKFESGHQEDGVELSLLKKRSPTIASYKNKKLLNYHVE